MLSLLDEAIVMVEDTLSDVLDRLGLDGYVDDFRATARGLRATLAKRTYAPEDLTIDRIERFEGMTDPDDEAIVFALRAPDGVRGTYAVPYGAAMAADDVTLVQRLPGIERLRRRAGSS